MLHEEHFKFLQLGNPFFTVSDKHPPTLSNFIYVDFAYAPSVKLHICALPMFLYVYFSIIRI